MVSQKYSVAEARKRLPALIRKVESGPHLELTRRGEPVAMLLSIEEYQHLIGEKLSFSTCLGEFLKQYEGLTSKEHSEVFSKLRDTSKGRGFQW